MEGLGSRPFIVREGPRTIVRKLRSRFYRYVRQRFRSSYTINSEGVIRVHVSSSVSLTRAQSEPKPDSINHSDLSIIFAQPQNVSTLLSLSPKLPTLKTIVSLGEIPEVARKIAGAWGVARGIRVLTLSEGEPGSMSVGPSPTGSHGLQPQLKRLEKSHLCSPHR